MNTLGASVMLADATVGARTSEWSAVSEDRVGFVPDGGYVVTTTDRSVVRQVVVDEQTLDKIAELLGIPKDERDQLIPDTRSIYIYRGTTNRSP